MQIPRKASRAIILLVIAIAMAIALNLAASCAKKAAAPAPEPVQTAEPAPEPEMKAPQSLTTLAERIIEVNVVDDRPTVSAPDRILNMPEWTIVGQKDQVYPAIGEHDDRLIRSEILRYSGGGPAEVTVDVFVTDGIQKFTAGERLQKITVSFGIRLEIASSTRVHDVVVTEGSASLDREALDIPYDTLYAAYAEVITSSIRDALDPVVETRNE
ncbi:MAG: hypothetical protein JSW50_11330 [Candidatus Latescibacterota bacterium]|nr:MAG: hypothetical protein JSW50_11330 [Candidatus Latescibacterota bacterium]